MQSKLIPPQKVEQDYKLFFAFMTLIMVVMYAMSINGNPDLSRPWSLVLFTALMVAHIVLHLKVNVIIQAAYRKPVYIVIQAILAFAIVYMSGNLGMIFALYMALIGETIGFLGLNRWSALTTVFYLALSLINFILFSNTESAIFWFASSIPTVIFVSLYVSLYTRQTEAREKAQTLAKELEIANKQLSEYAARVEDLTIAAERQRMARELHDTLSQGLAGLILQLEAVDAHLSNNRSEKAQVIISNAMLQARATLADARHAIDALRNTSQDDLETSVRFEASRFELATGVPCTLSIDINFPIPEPIKETIIRAVSEGLTNIACHAHARQVTIRISAVGNVLSAQIQDDGKGFDVSAVPSGHYGLLGLRERVRMVEGQFTIISNPQNGTILDINIPLTSPSNMQNNS